MKNFLLPFLLLSLAATAQPSLEKYLSNRSNSYDEVISFYRDLDRSYSNASLITCGPTDCGRPLHLFVISSDSRIDVASIKNAGKAVILINNGIHPGEPDGIDASMILAHDLLTRPEFKKLLSNTVVCIIPVFNIDGALNRGCCSRVNQDGPEEYGFRGNCQNLDLNRDFIKCDAQNTQSFQKIFREWDPDVFVDTHVSDGADYAYVMTLIATQHNKLEKSAGEYLSLKMLPALYQSMDEKGVPMCPYVHSVDETPDNGIMDFLETPRFASGYTALYNTFGLITESHMLKPFKDRVIATLEILHSVVEYSNAHAGEIREVRAIAKKNCAAMTRFALQWEADTSSYELIPFKGYEARFQTSNVTGLQRLYYDRTAPYEKQIRYYNRYKESLSVSRPAAYIIPQCWKKVIDDLDRNRIPMLRLASDTVINCEVYYIEDYRSTSQPYEGHYLHSQVEVRTEQQPMRFLKGDYVVSASIPESRFVVETLEPQGVDSYFAWGFFDAILQPKEYFSDYVFEDVAEELLSKDTLLRKVFEFEKKTDTQFASSANAQLYFIYSRSPYFENSYRRYPIARVVSEPVSK